MAKLHRIFLAFTIGCTCLAHAQSEPYREYRLLLGNPEESEIMATAGITLNKVFSDIYHRGFGPKLPEKIQPVAETVWSVYWTFFWSMWPHDAGHWVRARQSGGDFIIEKFGILFPVARMIQPDNPSPKHMALSSIGGHEINAMVMRQAHLDFLNHDYAFADELIHAFIQEVYFPAYAFVIAPAKPKEPETWTDTWGDPIESALIVYEAYTGRPAIREDGTVDPELISFYRETITMSVLWTLLDPMLYQTVRAFGTDMNENHGLMTPRMFGNEDIAWIWGTQFTASQLGYELYLTNYLKLNRKLYALYLRAGRPYRNLGIGFHIPGLVDTKTFTLGVAGDLWDQDMYGSGVAFDLHAKVQVSQHLGLLLRGGWKDEGYLVGRRVERSTILLAGISYRY